jgi:hypothetical protein
MGTKNFAWSSKTNNVPCESIQANFGKDYIVSKVALQGRGDVAQWVTKCAIFTKNSRQVEYVKIGNFKGCCDQNTIVYADF